MLMSRLSRLAAAIAAPLLLTGCLLAPGEFTSGFDVRADRSFTFTYVGEVHALNMDGFGDMMKNMGDDIGKDLDGDDQEDGDLDAEPTKALWQSGKDWATKPELDEDFSDENADSDGENGQMMSEEEKKALAEALSKEAGYRKVEYRGNDVFFVDYQISGRLDHAFLFPFNSDAEVIFPFVVAELRANGNVRIKAPAFAKSGSRMDMSGMDSKNDRIKGTFTITTDAELVSQNNEDGATTGPDGRKSIVWKIDPTTADAPTATIKF